MDMSGLDLFDRLIVCRGLFDRLIGRRGFLVLESVKCEHYSNITVK